MGGGRGKNREAKTKGRDACVRVGSKGRGESRERGIGGREVWQRSGEGLCVIIRGKKEWSKRQGGGCILYDTNRVETPYQRDWILIYSPVGREGKQRGWNTPQKERIPGQSATVSLGRNVMGQFLISLLLEGDSTRENPRFGERLN